MPHIIAEAGSNHNGSEQEALTLIDIAARSGADSVKFQIINPWGLYLPGDYKYGHYDIKNVIAIREAGVMADEVYFRLKEHADNKGIQFTASVFDEKGLDLLCKLDPPYIKIASCDLNNIRFLKQVTERGKKVIISTGMSTFEEIENTMNELHKHGSPDIDLLHCVSVYPAKTEDANLPFMKKLADHFGCDVGFSDHTGSSIAASIALSMGAKWVEKHFTRDKTLEGFDHAHAMNEEEFTAFVSDLRNAEKAIQPKDTKLTDAELYTKERARRSLYAARDLQPGETITDEDVLCVRPEGIMKADEIYLLIGEKVKTTIKQHQPFSLSLIE